LDIRDAGEEGCIRHSARCQELTLVAKYIVFIDAVIIHDDSASACCEALLCTYPKHHFFGLETAWDHDPELLGTYILDFPAFLSNYF
jgi:hypothetical protein